MPGRTNLRLATALLLAAALSACATKRVETVAAEPPVEPSETVHGRLFTPAGAGPFPAVVLLHGCGGMHRAIDLAWAQRLKSWGYVALVVDSFGPRGVRTSCHGMLHVKAPRTADAWGGVDYLKALDYVDAERIAFMGWSEGAGIALQASAQPAVLDRHRDSLKATVAFYPYCGPGSNLHAPTMVLVGDRDDWTGWRPCRTLARQQRQRGQPFDLVLYEGATHSFDCPECNGFYGKYFMAYNPAAHADALRRVRQFLGTHLR